MQKLKFNSKRQEELYNLIVEFEYASYVALKLTLQDKDRKLFKKNFKYLFKKNYIKVVKLGNKVYAFPVNNSEFFNEREADLFSWFYFKVIRSGGKLLKEENKIITAKEHVFTFEVLSEINSIKLIGDKNSYLATLEKLQNLKIPLHECLNSV